MEINASVKTLGMAVVHTLRCRAVVDTYFANHEVVPKCRNDHIECLLEKRNVKNVQLAVRHAAVPNT
jgi:hypothetical protein